MGQERQETAIYRREWAGDERRSGAHDHVVGAERRRGTASSFVNGISATASWKGFQHWVGGPRTGEDARRRATGTWPLKPPPSRDVGPRVANPEGGVCWGPVFIGRCRGAMGIAGGLWRVETRVTPSESGPVDRHSGGQGAPHALTSSTARRQSSMARPRPSARRTHER
jgi:hypothetical protein